LRRGPDDYIAGSAKMRRIMLTSKMLPIKRQEMEAGLGGGSKPRGRPRKSLSTPDDKTARIRIIKVEDEKENSSKKSVIERPGRRPVRKPRRFDGEGWKILKSKFGATTLIILRFGMGI
jgi:hypothetical protein